MNITIFMFQLKMVIREMEMLRSSTQKCESSMEEHKSKTHQLEQTLKHKNWELEDVTNTRNLRIQELENDNRHLEKKMHSNEKSYSEK